MKVGAWGVCTRLRNNTGVNGPSTFCTSKIAGFSLNYVENSTGINQFPLVADDATLLGLNSQGAIPILASGATSGLWLHVVAAIVTVMTVISLIVPPSYLGTESNVFYRIQKSGMLTIALGVVSFILAFVTFCVDLSIIIPARNRMNAIEGISAKMGNVQWFTLPSAVLMLPAFFSVLMTASPSKDFELVDSRTEEAR
ncbi:hypothetical protein RQP46_000910 [Phenoliferia psychrophenolica]